MKTDQGLLFTTLKHLTHNTTEWMLTIRLKRVIEEDTPLSFLTILEIGGLDDALWCLRIAPKEWEPNFRMYSIWCALHQASWLLKNPRAGYALTIAQKYALGTATEEDLRIGRETVKDIDSEEYIAWDILHEDHAVAALQVSRDILAEFKAQSDKDFITAYNEQCEMFIHMCKGTAPWQIPAEPVEWFRTSLHKFKE